MNPITMIWIGLAMAIVGILMVVSAQDLAIGALFSHEKMQQFKLQHYGGIFTGLIGFGLFIAGLINQNNQND